LGNRSQQCRRAGTGSAWETRMCSELVSTSDVVVSAIHEAGRF
jgi:hypothetical protein